MNKQQDEDGILAGHGVKSFFAAALSFYLGLEAATGPGFKLQAAQGARQTEIAGLAAVLIGIGLCRIGLISLVDALVVKFKFFPTLTFVHGKAWPD